MPFPEQITLHLKYLVACTLMLVGLMSPVQAQNKPVWVTFEEAMAKADATNRLILVDVWAPWCGWCHKMDEEVYPRLQPELADRFVFTRLNRDETQATILYQGRNFTEMELAQVFKTETVPAIVILNPRGEYLLHVSGFIKADRLQQILETVSSQPPGKYYSGSLAM